MVISLRKISRLLQMIILVCLFSFVLFKMFSAVNVWIQPTDKYRDPTGDALKVNSDLYNAQVDSVWLDNMLQRLKQFYYLGE